jgi:hypothetical protein
MFGRRFFCGSAVTVWSVACFAVPPAQPPWLPDCSKAVMPRHGVKGVLFGAAFSPDKVEISRGKPLGSGSGKRTAWFLTFRSGREFFADQEIKLFLLTPGSKPLFGTRYVVGTEGVFRMANPIRDGNVTYPPVQGVHLSKNAGRGRLPHTDMSPRFTLQLAFEQGSGERISGSIYLCTEGTPKSWIAGRFSAALQRLP